MTNYVVWKKNRPDGVYGGPWSETSHSFKARTNKEARSKLRRMFAGLGFHSMSLVAIPFGERPDPQQ